jgi:hypothetical protein
MAGIDQQGVVGLNGTVGQRVPMYKNMYLSVKIRGGLNTVLANITSVNLQFSPKKMHKLQF